MRPSDKHQGPQPDYRLRFVAGDADLSAPDIQQRIRRSEIVRENRAASQIPPLDAQAIFSHRITEQLDGGASALLTPERRDRLIALGRRLGMTRFNANLVIAQVQDATRRGEEDISRPAVQAKLDLVQEALHHKRMLGAGIAIAAMLLGMGMLMALIGWVEAG